MIWYRKQVYNYTFASAFAYRFWAQQLANSNSGTQHLATMQYHVIHILSTHTHIYIGLSGS